jgi:hypothetical protein
VLLRLVERLEMTQESPQKPVLPAGSRLSRETSNPTDSPELRMHSQCVGGLIYLAAAVGPDQTVAGVLRSGTCLRIVGVIASALLRES